MKRIKKGLLIVVASLSLTALSGCDFFTKDLDFTPQQEETPQDTNVAVNSVTLDKKTLDLFVTESAYLQATIAPENATNKLLTWTSDDEEIALVSATGKVTGLHAGTTKIKVASQEDPTKFDECEVSVSIKDETVHVTGLTLDRESADLYVGDTIKLNATIEPENATYKGVTFTSSNKNIAFVDSTGTVVAVNEGTATIIASSEENPEINDSCEISVSILDTIVHVTGLSVTPTEVELDLGGTTTVKPVVTIEPSDATNKAVNWTSSDSTKVVVDSQGNIVALAVTTDPVIVTVASDEMPSISRTISVTVVDTRDHSIHVESVLLPENLEIDLKHSSSATLTATVSPSNAGNKLIEWTSSDPSTVAIGSSVGETSTMLNALKTGTATITATSVDGSYSDTCLITVSDSTVYVSNIIIEKGDAAISNLDITLGSFESIKATIIPDNADNQGVVWELQEGAESYITLSTTTGSQLTIFGNAATPELTSFTVTARSVENNAIAATINVTVTDPTIYATGVGIYVEGKSGKQTSVNVEASQAQTVRIRAEIEPSNATNQLIEWVIPTTDKIITSENADHSLDILGRYETNEPIVIRARSKAQPDIYSEILVNVVDPTSLDRFVDFNDPADYLDYKLRTSENNLREVEGLANDSTQSDHFYKYDAADADKMVYKVGDQGLFRFAPSANVKLKGQSAQTTINNISTLKKLFLLADDNDENVSETDVSETMSNYVTINENGIDYQFKSAAIGKTFRLELEPDYTKYYSKNPQIYQFEFKVIQGYNVDSLAELSLFDNVQSAWNDYKTATGLTAAALGGIILHKDIEITADIIPSSFKQSSDDLAAQKVFPNEDFNTWAETYFDGATPEEQRANAEAAFVGSPKDYTTLFCRSTLNENFSFEGNFFNIDYSHLKPVYLIQDKRTVKNTLAKGLQSDGSHASLFSINNSDVGAPNPDKNHKHTVEMRNFSAKGNGGLSIRESTQELDPLNKGGFMAFKMNSAQFNIQNSIVSSAFISFMVQENAGVQSPSNTSMNADRITSYDSYSNMFFVHGVAGNTVTNSWLSKSGGPLVMLNEPYENTDWYDTVNECSMDCTNCYLMNEVMGTEPWFEGHTGSTALVQNYLVTPGLSGGWYYNVASAVEGGRTISRKKDESTKYVNFIALDVDANNFDGNHENNLHGSFTVNNGPTASATLDMNRVARSSDGFGIINQAQAYQLGILDGSQMFYLFAGGENTLAVYDVVNVDSSTFQPTYVPVFKDYSSQLGGSGLFTSPYACGYLNAGMGNGYVKDGKYIGFFLGTYPINN